MRTMTYRLKLYSPSEQSYVISNSTDTDLGDLGACADEIFAPAIKMTLRDLPDEDDADSREEFLRQFDMTDCWNTDLQDCYQRTLCGEDTGWKLVKIGVHKDYLVLTLASEQRWNEACSGVKHAEDDWFYDDLIYFWPSKEDGGGGLFRFDVERTDGVVEFYNVSIDRDDTRIEEHIGNQIRSITFDRGESEEEWVTIKWRC